MSNKFNTGFGNPIEIKKKLIDASLYLSFYEILKTTIINKIAFFYNSEFKNGKFVESEEYKEKIRNQKHKNKENIFLSSCQWLKNNEAISCKEYDLIIQIKKHRNIIAHDLPEILLNSEYIIDEYLFNQLKILILKIDKWWIVNFEIPINPDFDGQTIDPNKITSGKDVMLNYIFNIATTDVNELQKMYNKTLEKIEKNKKNDSNKA